MVLGNIFRSNVGKSLGNEYCLILRGGKMDVACGMLWAKKTHPASDTRE